MKKIIVVYIILLQIITVAVLAFNIYHKKQVLGTVSINPIRKEEIISDSGNELKHFYEPKPNSNDPDLNNFSSINADYTINSDSLNERFDYSIQKPEDIFRIITLGDSFTYGQYVDTKSNWTELLEDKLNLELKCIRINKFEVLNLAVGGYDDRYSVERYKKRGVKYNPDLILWLQTDMFRINEKLYDKYFQLQIEASNSGGLQKQTEEGINHVRWARARQEIIQRMGESSVLNYQESTIKKIEDYYKRPLILLSLPTLPEKQKYSLKALGESITLWGFYDGLRNIYSEGGSFSDSHPNQKGHRMIAEDIFNYLRSSGIIPCD